MKDHFCISSILSLQQKNYTIKLQVELQHQDHTLYVMMTSSLDEQKFGQNNATEENNKSF